MDDERFWSSLSNLIIARSVVCSLFWNPFQTLTRASKSESSRERGSDVGSKVRQSHWLSSDTLLGNISFWRRRLLQIYRAERKRRHLCKTLNQCWLNVKPTLIQRLVSVGEGVIGAAQIRWQCRQQQPRRSNNGTKTGQGARCHEVPIILSSGYQYLVIKRGS